MVKVRRKSKPYNEKWYSNFDWYVQQDEHDGAYILFGLKKASSSDFDILGDVMVKVWPHEPRDICLEGFDLTWVFKSEMTNADFLDGKGLPKTWLYRKELFNIQAELYQSRPVFHRTVSMYYDKEEWSDYHDYSEKYENSGLDMKIEKQKWLDCMEKLKSEFEYEKDWLMINKEAKTML